MNAIVTIPFHGDNITAVETPDGVFVAVKPISDRLGLDWKSQHRKLSSEKERWGMVITGIPSAGGTQETACIPLSRLCAWLFSVHPAKVHQELQEGLRAYQMEAADVLDAHFRLQQSRLTTEVARLHGEAAQLRAFLLSCHPLWAKIANLQKAGVPVYMLAYHLRRGQNETFEMVRHMEKLGIIENRNWWRYVPEADEPEADEAGALEAGVSHG